MIPVSNTSTYLEILIDYPTQSQSGGVAVQDFLR
jgi:hypothetical protein